MADLCGALPAASLGFEPAVAYVEPNRVRAWLGFGLGVGLGLGLALGLGLG